MDLCDPNLHFDPFTIPQINSSELEIFLSLKGEKHPWDRADFVSLGLKFLFPSVYWAPRKKHLHPELQGELRPELFRWLIQVTFSPCIYRHSLARIWKDLNHLAPCPPSHQYCHTHHSPHPPPPPGVKEKHIQGSEKTYCIHVGQLLCHKILWEAREFCRPSGLQFLFLFQAAGDGVGKPICWQMLKQLVSWGHCIWPCLWSPTKRLSLRKERVTPSVNP